MPDKVIATAFANSGAIITGSLVIIFGADIPIAGLLALLAELDALLRVNCGSRRLPPK